MLLAGKGRYLFDNAGDDGVFSEGFFNAYAEDMLEVNGVVWLEDELYYRYRAFPASRVCWRPG